jgi:transposase
MLCPDLRGVRVYLHREPVDMRRQRNGLAALVRAVINQDPFGNALFCFIGKGRDKLKILYWNRNGFVVWYKVIEGKEKFHWPRVTGNSATSFSTFGSRRKVAPV